MFPPPHQPAPPAGPGSAGVTSVATTTITVPGVRPEGNASAPPAGMGHLPVELVRWIADALAPKDYGCFRLTSRHIDQCLGDPLSLQRYVDQRVAATQWHLRRLARGAGLASELEAALDALPFLAEHWHFLAASPARMQKGRKLLRAVLQAARRRASLNMRTYPEGIAGSLHLLRALQHTAPRLRDSGDARRHDDLQACSRLLAQQVVLGSAAAERQGMLTILIDELATGADIRGGSRNLLLLAQLLAELPPTERAAPARRLGSMIDKLPPAQRSPAREELARALAAPPPR